MNKLLGAAVMGLVLTFAEAASAQVYYETYSPVVTQALPVTTYYAPPVAQAYTSTTAYSAGLATSATYCPTTTYSPVVATAYSPVVTTAYSPVYTTYSPVTAVPVSTYYAPAVSYSPVVTYSAPVVYARPLYVPGQPVRNFYRRLWW